MTARTSAVAKPPIDDLMAPLGDARPLFEALASPPGCRGEWKRYSAKSDWVWKVMEGDRTLCYLQPLRGAVAATVVLGGKAVASLMADAPPAALRRAIEAATIYPEGRPVRIEVKRTADVTLVQRLIAAKLAPQRRSSGSRRP